MNLNIARLGALGTISIGLLSASLSGGCAAGAGAPNPGSSEGVDKSSQPVITPVSLNTDGACGAVGTFAVTSPQVISFIAANASQFKNAQFQLFRQDQKGTLVQMNTTAQQASNTFAAMLSASSASTAMQDTKVDQVASAAAANTATTAASATEADDTHATGTQTAFSDSDTTVLHHDDHTASASGTASNTAFNSNMAINMANGQNGASNAASQNFLATALQQSTIPAFFGGIVTIPITTSSTANQSNTTGSAATSFFNNGSTAAAAATTSNVSAFSNASHSANTTFDKIDQDTHSGSSFDTNLSHSLTASNGSAVVNSSSNGSSLDSEQSSSASQGASNSLTQGSSNVSTSGTQVFNSLDTMNSNSFVLVATLLADQRSTILQIFQGSNGVVTGNQSFPIVVPTCGN